MKYDLSKLASPWEIALGVWSVFASFWRPLLSIAVWQLTTLLFTLPPLLYSFGRFDKAGDIVQQLPADPNAYFALLLLSAAASAAAAGLLHPTIIALAYMRLIGKPFTARQAFARAKQVFWRYLGTLLAIAFLIGLTSLLPTIIGFPLSLVLAVYLMFAAQAVVIDDLGPLEALLHGVRLVRGRFWSTAWRLAIVAGLFALAAAVVSYFLVWSPLGWLDLHLMPIARQKAFLVFFSVLGMCLSAIAVPVFLLIQTVFYIELRRHHLKQTKASPI